MANRHHLVVSEDLSVDPPSVTVQRGDHIFWHAGTTATAAIIDFGEETPIDWKKKALPKGGDVKGKVKGNAAPQTFPYELSSNKLKESGPVIIVDDGSGVPPKPKPKPQASKKGRRSQRTTRTTMRKKR